MSNYKKEKDADNIRLAQTIQTDMPPVMVSYLNSRGTGLTSTTLLGYTNKLHIFSQFLCLELPSFLGKKATDLTLEDIGSITSEDIVTYVYWLKTERKLERNGEIITLKPNSNRSVNNYLSCLNAFYSRLVKENKLKINPVAAVDRPSMTKSDIVIHLKEEEKESFINSVEYGTGLNNRTLLFHQKNQCRDIAICQLFLNTGARISELVGLNVSDVNFKDCCIRVTRKRDKTQELYFSDLTASYLQDYLEERIPKYKPADGEDALFLSRDGKRLGVRSIEKMVKRYVQASNPQKNDTVTPHKLRSTFAMNVLEKTGNIELVRAQLGHESVATTSVYAKASNRMLKEARNILDS